MSEIGWGAAKYIGIFKHPQAVAPYECGEAESAKHHLADNPTV